MSRTDTLILLFSSIAVASSYAMLWGGEGAGDRATVWADGTEAASVLLDTNRSIEVEGPAGTSVIEIEPGRARVRSSPGARQLCVRQGWLSRAGDSAVCLPNRVVVTIDGSEREFDAIGF